MYPIFESPSHRDIFISYCLHCDTAEMIRVQKSINPACIALPSMLLRYHGSEQPRSRKFTGLFGGVDETISKVGKVHNQVCMCANISAFGVSDMCVMLSYNSSVSSYMMGASWLTTASTDSPAHKASPPAVRGTRCYDHHFRKDR